MRPRSVVARRSYTASKVRGGRREETPPPPRSGAARRSHLAPEARGGDPEEPPEPEARGGSWEEQL